MYQLPLCGKIHITGLVAGGNFSSKLEGEEKIMKNSIDTKCVQGGYRPGNGEPRQIPIVQSTTFKYDTSEDMGKLFDL